MPYKNKYADAAINFTPKNVLINSSGQIKLLAIKKLDKIKITTIALFNILGSCSLDIIREYNGMETAIANGWTTFLKVKRAPNTPEISSANLILAIIIG